MTNEIFFSDDRETKEWILSTFDMKLDDENNIVTASEPERKILSRDGEEMYIDDWIGIDNGSLAFIRGSPKEIVRMAKKKPKKSRKVKIFIKR